MIPWIKTNDGNFTFVLDGKSFTIDNDNANLFEIEQLVFRQNLTEEEKNKLINLCDMVNSVKEYIKSTDIELVNGSTVRYNNEQLSGTIVERICDFIKKDYPVAPLVNFLKKLFSNPSYSSRTELYDFLEHKNLPICEDGDFLAYKAVRSNFYDKYKGIYDNSIGNTVAEPRGSVNDDRNIGCSRGLHAGTLEYVRGFASFGDKVIIVKINPANVVSVPLDCNCQKLRTCEYYCLKEYTGPMEYSLSDNHGEEWEDDDATFLDDHDVNYPDDGMYDF